MENKSSEKPDHYKLIVIAISELMEKTSEKYRKDIDQLIAEVEKLNISDDEMKTETEVSFNIFDLLDIGALAQNAASSKMMELNTIIKYGEEPSLRDLKHLYTYLKITDTVDESLRSFCKNLIEKFSPKGGDANG